MVIRVDLDRMHAHHRRMARVAVATLVICGAVGVAAPILSLYLGVLSAVAAVGVLFGVDMLLRARRGLQAEAALVVEIEGRRVTARYEGKPPHVVTQPILGGQAFPDHLQLVAGTSPSPLFQVEIPTSPEERPALLAQIAAEGVAAPARRAVSVHLAMALTLVPAVVIPLFVLAELVGVALTAGLWNGLVALGPKLGLAVMLGLALLGGLVFLRRVVATAGARGRPSR